MKVGGDLSKCKLKGALDADELLYPDDAEERSAFLEIDPRDGFSVRNFHIQAAKMAKVSDIVVYGENGSTDPEVRILAKRIAQAQRGWAQQVSSKERDMPKFNTFVVSSKYPSIKLTSVKSST